MSSSVHEVAQRGLNASTVLNIKGDFALDEAVVQVLPPGTTVLSANNFGSSAWTITARIDVKDPNGEDKRYFLKCAAEDAGKKMMEGEFNSMSELYKTSPAFVPAPHAWGKFKQAEPEIFFFLCDFIDMSNKLPDPISFTQKLAHLHRSSVSPTGKFGFHVPTCHGKYTQFVEWDASWVSFFTKLLAESFHLDRENNEPWPELNQASERTLTHVVPRLLGPLESNGRSVKPCLIHGDLWEGNIGTDPYTGNIYIFDAGAYYAHNEMEIGMWRCKRHGINSRIFKREYLRNFPPSQPIDEWEDRNRLYCIKMNAVHSAHHVGVIERNHIFEDMSYLIDKYAPWSQGGAAGVEETNSQEQAYAGDQE